MRLILTGGFLGSGKTTAIVNACNYLIKKGKRVAVVTNDQGDQQVDSAYIKSLGINTREVSNGCFCCRYSELDSHLQSLNTQHHPEIVFAESVGSCTDLVATIAKPLRQFKPEISSVISVFADASMVASLVDGRSSFLDETVRYIYKKQLEEADLIVLNKVDLLSNDELVLTDRVIRTEYPSKSIIHQNSLTEEGVARWMEAISEIQLLDNRSSLALDYDIYGNGEARLAWFDKSLVISSPHGHAGFAARQVIRTIFNELKSRKLPIGHLKFFVETDRWSEKISLTAASVSADFKISAEDIEEVRLLINARIQTEPEILERLVNDVIWTVQQKESVTIVPGKQASFSPGFPRPTHRVA